MVEVRLRDVREDDVDVYVRMRCDPVMMAELGGPLPAEGMTDKVRRDVATVAAGEGLVCMVEVDGQVAGSVVLWTNDQDPPVSETGWMVLPEWQGQGIGKEAMRQLLARARAEGRWGTIYASPGVTNAASNAMCRSLGFTLQGQEEVDFAGRILAVNIWRLDPAVAPGGMPGVTTALDPS